MNKVCLKKIWLNGFKMELYYYKDKPDDFWFGVGDKVSLIQEHEARGFFSMGAILLNKFRVMGEYNKKNTNKKFQALMKEKTERDIEEKAKEGLEGSKKAKEEKTV